MKVTRMAFTWCGAADAAPMLSCAAPMLPSGVLMNSTVDRYLDAFQ